MEHRNPSGLVLTILRLRTQVIGFPLASLNVQPLLPGGYLEAGWQSDYSCTTALVADFLVHSLAEGFINKQLLQPRIQPVE